MAPPLTGRSALPAGSQPTALSTTDPRLGSISPSTLSRHRDQPVSVSSPALEQAIVQLSAITSPIGTTLTSREVRLIRDIFGDSVDASRIRIVEARIANAPTTLGNQIRVEPGFSFDSEENQGILIHETTHIWQYQTRGTSYITDSAYHQVSALIAAGTREAAYFNYRLRAGGSIYSYSAEEQAVIVQDYYEMTRRFRDVRNPPAWVTYRRADLALYEPLIREMRRASPLPETAIYERNLMTLPGWETIAPAGMEERQMVPTMPLLRFQF